MLRERLSKNLKELRQGRAMTQEFAAELCEISPRFWGKMERQEVDPTLKTVEKLAAGLDVSVEDLLRE